jgi:hypothetical protein
MKVFLFFMLVFVFIFSSCNRNKSKSGDETFSENQKDSISFSNSVNPIELVDSSFRRMCVPVMRRLRNQPKILLHTPQHKPHI